MSADVHGDEAGNGGSILLVICHQSLLRVLLRLLLVDVEVSARDVESLQLDLLSFNSTRVHTLNCLS